MNDEIAKSQSRRAAIAKEKGRTGSFSSALIPLSILHQQREDLSRAK